MHYNFTAVQVLSSCVRCAAGCHLSNRNVILIFEACFRIGHYQTERSKDMSGGLALALWLLSSLDHVSTIAAAAHDFNCESSSQ